MIFFPGNIAYLDRLPGTRDRQWPGGHRIDRLAVAVLGHHAADVALDAFTTTWTPVTQQVGAGTGTTEEFLYTYYHDSRSQMIFLASELGAAGNITNIAFYLTSVPSPATLSACTVRLKHTALAA